MPLLNVRTAPYGAPFPLLGQVFEVDPMDPFLPLLWGNPMVDGLITNGGVWLPAQRLAVPRIGPAAVGLWLGLEFGLVDLPTGEVPETTQSVWVYIQT